MKNAIIFSLKVIIAIGLFYYFFNGSSIDINGYDLLLEYPFRIFFSVIICAFLVPITTYRWYLLLNTGGMKFDLKNVFYINYIGIFFNTVIPGSLGGEVFKSLFIYKYADENRTKAVFSVIIDRGCGLIGLMIVCALGIIISWRKIIEIPLLLTLSLGLISSLVLCVLAICIILMTNKHVDRYLQNKLFKQKSEFIKNLMSIVGAISHYRNNISIFPVCVGLSIMLHLSSVLFLYIISSMFHSGSIIFTDYMAALSFANISNLIPVTPGGLGIGEVAYAQIMEQLTLVKNTSNFILQYLALRISWVIISLPGMVVYVLYKNK